MTARIYSSQAIRQRPAISPHARSVGWILSAIGFGVVAVAITHTTWEDILKWALDDPESGQVLLTPFAFIILVLARRKAPATMARFEAPRKQNPAAVWLPGPLLVAIGWVAWSVGFFHNHDLLWHGGAVCMMVGAATTLLGAAALIRFWPAFLVLAFLVPVTGLGRLYVSGPLQVVTARATQALCEVTGATVSRHGSVLRINGHEVAIAEGCNGLRLVWPLFLTCYLFAFITQMRPWVRALVLASSPVIAVAANVLRLAPTIWAYGHWDAHSAAVLHDVSGWVMLIVSFLTLVGLARMIRWALPGSDVRPSHRGGISQEYATSVHSPGHVIAAATATALLLMGVAMEAWHVADKPIEAQAVRYNRLVKDAVDRAPIRIGSWSGRDVPLDDATNELKPNLAIRREYFDNQTGRRATLLLVQVSDARRLAPHSAPVCYDYSGWELTSRAPHNWSAADLVMSGMEYEFYRGGLEQSIAVAVADFLLLPDGRIARDNQPVLEWARQSTKRFYGAAHLQVVCDAAIPEQDREQIVRELLTGYAPLIRAICQIKVNSLSASSREPKTPDVTFVSSK
jgi:exosortase